MCDFWTPERICVRRIGSCLYCPCHTNTFSKHRLSDHIFHIFQAAAAAATFYIVTFIESIKQAKNQYLRVQMCLFFFPLFRLWKCLCAGYYRLFVCAFSSKANRTTNKKKKCKSKTRKKKQKSKYNVLNS